MDSSNLEHLSRGARLPVLDDHVVEEDDLGDLHGDVVLVCPGLEVAGHTRSDAEGWHSNSGNRVLN